MCRNDIYSCILEFFSSLVSFCCLFVRFKIADRDDEVDLAEVSSPQTIQATSQRAEERTSIVTETAVSTSVTDRKINYSE